MFYPSRGIENYNGFEILQLEHTNLIKKENNYQWLVKASIWCEIEVSTKIKVKQIKFG